MVGYTSRKDYGKLVEGLELALEGSIFRLLVSRGPGAVVTLSDAALAVGGDGWRALLDLTLTVAHRMAQAGVLEFVHGNEPLGDPSMATGSAAVRLRPGRAARIVGSSRLN
jgi:hypothetical protein